MPASQNPTRIQNKNRLRVVAAVTGLFESGSLQWQGSRYRNLGDSWVGLRGCRRRTVGRRPFLPIRRSYPKIGDAALVAAHAA